MKSRFITQFPGTVLLFVALLSMSLVSSGTGTPMVNRQKNHPQKRDPAVVTIENNVATQTPTATAILSSPEPALLAGDPANLFSPDQISGGLQTTVNGVKWGTDSSDSSVDPQSDSGWSDVTVLISVKCILKDGCQNISVMDYDLTYDNKYVGVLVYGAQREFGNTDLKPDETASGSITFSIPSTAKTLALRYAPKPMTIAEFSK
ncbi:MAG: DUF4352 domain-containing protein [Anaerolineales bacterium]